MTAFFHLIDKSTAIVYSGLTVNEVISKANKAGFKAYRKGDRVIVVFPMSFFGHDNSSVNVEIRNVKEYNLFVGGI